MYIKYKTFGRDAWLVCTPKNVNNFFIIHALAILSVHSGRFLGHKRIMVDLSSSIVVG